jgi:glycosyltransferase involved in cell wall biosynthesis
LSDLAFDLADRGYDVHVITSRQRYDDASARLPAESVVKSVRIHRVWTSQFGRGHLPGRVIDYLTFYLTTAWGLWHLIRRGDVVVAKTDPPLISVVAGWVAGCRGAMVVNWLQDLFPEVAIELNVRFLQGWMGKLLEWLRNRSLHGARMNVVLGRLMSDRLAALNVDRDRMRIIHNWADGRAIVPIPPDDNPLRKEWGLEGRFVVGYSGNLGRAHEFSTLLEAMERLKEDDRIVFLLIGGGPRLAWVKLESARRGLTNVLFKPYQPRELLCLSLAVPDLHVVVLQPRLEGLIVPSKFYGIAAAGRPTLLIGAKDGEIARILNETEAGFVFPVGAGEALADMVAELSSDPARCLRLGRNARTVFEQRFDCDLALRAWRDLLSGLADAASVAVASGRDGA